MMWLLFACTGEENLDLDLKQIEQQEQTRNREEGTGLAEERTIHFLYSNALVGEIEPCG